MSLVTLVKNTLIKHTVLLGGKTVVKIGLIIGETSLNENSLHHKRRIEESSVENGFSGA
jgi:bifunctional N-acetylglucosamine-1-phosphate-uridyltransferase/glucosamine-1-phosphate-acetyltransferase GlmU-like protein